MESEVLLARLKKPHYQSYPESDEFSLNLPPSFVTVESVAS
jgi:hypothetical protein